MMFFSSLCRTATITSRLHSTALYAKANNGTFLVRIDDTDTERSTEEFKNDIIQNFRWLGIDWDEGVDVGGSHGEYKQSLRFDRYQEVADQLLSEGLAYEDDGAVRFKVPDNGSIEFNLMIS